MMVISPVGCTLSRSNAHRRFSSRKAFEVSRNRDSESQYERSALSQLDQEEPGEEELVEVVQDELLEFFCLLL